jgi:transposase
MLEGMLWILRTSSPWRDLPPEFGPWKSVHTRFSTWTKNGLWTYILGYFKETQADAEYVMVDSSIVRVHQDAMRARRCKDAEAIGRSRGGQTTKIHMACDALGYPLAFIATSGERGDATQAIALLRRSIDNKTEACLLDCGYDSDDIRSCIMQTDSTAVIPQNPTRTGVLPFDKHLYKERHKVENLFQKMKRYRRIASRFEMKVTHFAAMITLACIMIWIKF